MDALELTSLGEERANLIGFRAFVRLALVWFCLFPLPLGVWEGPRFVIVALPGLFSYLFLPHSIDPVMPCGPFRTYPILLTQSCQVDLQNLTPSIDPFMPNELFKTYPILSTQLLSNGPFRTYPILLIQLCPVDPKERTPFYISHAQRTF